jgi:hypothetical protein
MNPTTAVIEPTVTSVIIELVDIYTTYYWLAPGVPSPEHLEVIKGDQP